MQGVFCFFFPGKCHENNKHTYQQWKEVWINNSGFTPSGISECSVRPEERKKPGWEPRLPSLDSSLLLDNEMDEVELSFQGNGKSETVTFTFSRRSVSITLDQTVALNEWNPVPWQHSKQLFQNKGRFTTNNSY